MAVAYGSGCRSKNAAWAVSSELPLLEERNGEGCAWVRRSSEQEESQVAVAPRPV